MLLAIRGSAFENDDLIYPALLHGVPAADSPSAILTFDLMPRSKRQQEEAEYQDLQMDDDLAEDVA
jgi:hypothetical protein